MECIHIVWNRVLSLGASPGKPTFHSGGISSSSHIFPNRLCSIFGGIYISPLIASQECCLRWKLSLSSCDGFPSLHDLYDPSCVTTHTSWHELSYIRRRHSTFSRILPKRQPEIVIRKMALWTAVALSLCTFYHLIRYSRGYD